MKPTTTLLALLLLPLLAQAAPSATAPAASRAKPGAAITIAAPEFIDAATGSEQTVTITFKTPADAERLLLTLNPSRGVNLLSTTNTWNLDLRSQPAEISVRFAVDDQSLQNLMFHAEMIRAGKSSRRVLGVAINAGKQPEASQRKPAAQGDAVISLPAEERVY